MLLERTHPHVCGLFSSTVFNRSGTWSNSWGQSWHFVLSLWKHRNFEGTERERWTFAQQRKNPFQGALSSHCHLGECHQLIMWMGELCNYLSYTRSLQVKDSCIQCTSTNAHILCSRAFTWKFTCLARNFYSQLQSLGNFSCSAEEMHLLKLRTVAYKTFRGLEQSLNETCPGCNDKSWNAWAQCFVECEDSINSQLKKDIVCANIYTEHSTACQLAKQIWPSNWSLLQLFYISNDVLISDM